MTNSKVIDALSLIEILREAIQREHDSSDYYHKAASAAFKPASKKMFLKLAEMEKGHASELTRHLSDLEAQMQVDKALTASF